MGMRGGMGGMHWQGHGHMHGQGTETGQRQRHNRDYLRNPSIFSTYIMRYLIDEILIYLRTDFTSIKQNLCAIKRTQKNASQWKNMYGLKHIKHNIKSNTKYPCKYEWTLQPLYRKQIVLENAADICENIGDDDNKQNAKKLESFEIQYMDVMVGMVNVNKMPANQTLTKAFNMY